MPAAGEGEEDRCLAVGHLAAAAATATARGALGKQGSGLKFGVSGVFGSLFCHLLELLAKIRGLTPHRRQLSTSDTVVTIFNRFDSVSVIL